MFLSKNVQLEGRISGRKKQFFQLKWIFQYSLIGEINKKASNNLENVTGCSSAREILQRNPNLRVALVEKENKLAFHQSGRNSGDSLMYIQYA